MATKSKTEEQGLKSAKKEDGKKEEEEEENIPDVGGVKRLKKEYGGQFALIYLLGWINAFLNGGIMVFFGVFFERLFEILAKAQANHSSFEKESRNLLIYFIALGVGAFILTLGQYYFWGYYGTKIGITVRKEYFLHLIRQDITYHDKETSAKINAYLTTETAAIEAGLGIKFGFFVQQLGQTLLGFATAFYYSWELALVLIAIMPVLACIGMIQGYLFKNMGKSSDPFVDCGTFSQEVIMNIRTVLSIPTLIISKTAQFSVKLAEGSKIAIKRSFIVSLGLGFFMFGIIGIVYAVGIISGAKFIKDGDISVGEFFGCFFSFFTGGMGLGQLMSVMPDIQKANSSANRFYSIKDRKPEVKDPENGGQPIDNKEQPLRGDIEFRDISFFYASEPDINVLKNISFSIKSNTKVALVGPSGSGKSTVISLLERFYDPRKGNIYIDNQPINNYDLNYLRSQIGLVSQMPLLFDETIENNIRGGYSNKTKEDIYNAAKLANAHDFIEKLANGYDTKVGELGNRLSGGQKQRIAIARALLSNPPILLFDEATSALDSKSEKEVQDAIDKISENTNKTIISIAHRLSTIKNYDKIIVLVDGDIKEVGNHNSLMNDDGVYAALVNAQQLIEIQHQQHRQKSVEIHKSETTDAP